MHLYLHVPFCKQACHYCDFHFSTSLKYKTRMVNAICKEIALRSEYLDTSELETIYFGGGTPSLLTTRELQQIFETISRFYSIKSTAEITLEANPDDINISRLREWKNIGINRLSIGIQSFNEEQLIFLNRAHTSQEAMNCISKAREIGFEQLTIDLIYAIPSDSNDIWKYNIDRCHTLELPHISAYCLTIEEKTAFGKWLKSGKLPPISDQFATDQFEILVREFKEAKYEQYEISNFAKDGQYAIHNTSYWQGKAYLGVGPSAHSFDGKFSRQWNVSNNIKYIQALENDTIPFEQETLTKVDRANELLMTGLRTQWGIDLTEIESLIPGYSNEYASVLLSLQEKELVVKSNSRIILTNKGKWQADGIASELFA